MKNRGMFSTLFANEFTAPFADKSNVVAFLLTVAIYWGCAIGLPWLLLFREVLFQYSFAMLLESGFVQILAVLFLGLLAVATALATVPALGAMLVRGAGHPGIVFEEGKFEFLFTRAVNRRLLFRARMAALFFVMVAPFFLNVLVSPWMPSGEQPRSILPLFTLWMASNITLAFILLQTYGTLIAPLVKPNQWWTAVFYEAPVLLLLGKLIFSIHFSSNSNFCENGFLFFANHMLALTAGLVVLAVASEIWCEKRFSKLEIL